jgi:sigma-B regulation protein RsbU (phosphoserine phosphatase)
MSISPIIQDIPQLKDTVKKLNTKVSDLSCLMRVSSILNSTLNLADLLQNIMEISEQVLNAEASSLMLIDEAANELVFEITRGAKGKEIKEKFRLKMGQGIAGWVAQHGEPLLIPDVAKDPRFYSKPDKSTGFVTRSIGCVPLRVKRKIIGILEIINPVGKKEFDETDMQMLSAFSDSAAVAIENARMVERLIENQRVEQELSIAKQIQENFLPHRFPKVEGAQVFARNVTALEIGGDFYDFVRLGKDRLAVFIGDVSGKGVPAALYMVKIITDFRSIISAEEEPSKVIEDLNDRLCRQSTMGMFATVVFGIYDAQKSVFTFINGGHPAPVLIDKDNNVRLVEGARNPPVGIQDDIAYAQSQVALQPLDRLLFYTDGVVEARNKAKAEYGMERLFEVLRKTESAPKKVVNAVLRDIIAFSKNVSQHDDITLVSLKAGRGQKE